MKFPGWNSGCRGRYRYASVAGPAAQLLLALTLGAEASWADTAGLPEEIRIIVPVTAGSSLDARARIIAEALGRRIQRRVLVENRTGAGGTLGALAVAKATPDGSMLLFTNNSHVVSPRIYPDPGYDAL